MDRFRLMACVLGLSALACTVQSCTEDDDDTDITLLRPTALVTVRPAGDGTFTLQLDDTTTLSPSNMKSSPYGDKKVRALVNYTEESSSGSSGSTRSVHVNWMDSIRTKAPVPDLGTENDSKYGDDAVEIVKDWVTVAEDGYLTLRVRTLWGTGGNKHYINLLTGANADDAYELELRHDANGDTGSIMGDALVAFDLNDLPRKDGRDVKLKLSWKSFSGKKSAEFDLHLHAAELTDCAASMEHTRNVE